MRKLLLLTLPALLGVQPLAAQEIKSPADLMPAGVAAYGELRQPGKVAMEIGKILEPSVLGNVPDSLAKVRAQFEKVSMRRHNEAMNTMGILFSPEVAKELERVQGAAIALTGLDPRGEPEFVVVVLPGQSNVPNFMMKTYLTMDRVRQTDSVEGVHLYRMYSSAFVVQPNKEDKPQPPAVREFGPVFAQMPGLVVLGSPAAVKDVISRAKGKARGPVLSGDAAFLEASKQVGQKNGVFAYVSPQHFQQMVLAKGNPGPETAFLGMMQTWQSLAYSLSLDQGSLHIRKVAQVNPKYKDVIGELAPSRPVDQAILHYVPQDAVAALAVSNADGEKRLAKMIELVDQNVPAIAGKKPSELLQDFQDQIGINLGKDILGPITGFSLAMGDPLKAQTKRVEVKGPNFQSVTTTTEVPMVFIAQAADDEAAKKLLAVVPKIYALLARENVEPKMERVAGQELLSLKGNREGPLFFARQGRTIVAGPYAGPVAAALAAGADKKGLRADAKFAERLKELDDPFAIVVLKPVSLATSVFQVRSSSHMATGKAVAEPAKKDEGKKPDIKEQPRFEQEKQRGVQEKQGETKTVTVNPPRDPEEERILKALGTILEAEDFLLVGATFKKDRIEVQGKLPGLVRTVPRIIDFAIEEGLRTHAQFAHSHEHPIGPAGGTGKVIMTIQDRLTNNDPKDRIRQNSHHKVHVLKMEAGRTYTIDLVSQKENFFDNYLRLEDAAGNPLAQDDDSGGGLNARIVFRPTRAENYRIIATSFGGAVGSYTLTVRESGDDKK